MPEIVCSLRGKAVRCGKVQSKAVLFREQHTQHQQAGGHRCQLACWQSHDSIIEPSRQPFSQKAGEKAVLFRKQHQDVDWTCGQSGQIATEYLILVIFLLLVTGVIFGFSLSMISDAVAVHKAKDASLKIRSAAENIAGLGEGSRTTISIDLPDRIASAFVRENFVAISMFVSSGTTTYAEESGAMFTPVSLPAGAGTHFLVLEVVDGNVLITE